MNSIELNLDQKLFFESIDCESKSVFFDFIDALNEFRKKKVEKRVPKAKSTYYMPARPSRKVEIRRLCREKTFRGSELC